MPPFIKREWMLPISIAGTIVDVETTSLEPKDGEILTCGFFSGNKITIFQRSDPSEEGRRKFFSILYNWEKFSTRPFYAYNKQFEEKWLNINFDHDLMQKWKAQAEQKAVKENHWVKWPRVSELISLPHNYYGLKDIDGKDVPQLWKEYCKTKQEALLDRIIHHNLNDLIREACVLMWDETSARTFAEILFKGIQKERKI